MKTTHLAIMTLASALTATVSPGVGRGDTSDKPRVESLPVAGSSIERVRGTVAINVPVERVRAIVFDFPRYPELMPRYRRAVIERKNPSGSLEVRLDIEELAGAVHVWVRLEVTAAERVGAVESYKGRLLGGNVKAFEIRWELEALGPTKTRLTVESFMDPNLRLVPSALINSGARDRIRDVVMAFKTRAEKK